jgi:hypothetical protein
MSGLAWTKSRSPRSEVISPSFCHEFVLGEYEVRPRRRHSRTAAVSRCRSGSVGAAMGGGAKSHRSVGAEHSGDGRRLGPLRGAGWGGRDGYGGVGRGLRAVAGTAPEAMWVQFRIGHPEVSDATLIELVGWMLSVVAAAGRGNSHATGRVSERRPRQRQRRAEAGMGPRPATSHTGRGPHPEAGSRHVPWGARGSRSRPTGKPRRYQVLPLAGPPPGKRAHRGVPGGRVNMAPAPRCPARGGGRGPADIRRQGRTDGTTQ